MALPSTGGSTSYDAVANVFVDFVPFVGDVKGVGEAIAGRDVLGNELAWWERGLGFVFLSDCLLYTSPSPRDQKGSRMPSSA